MKKLSRYLIAACSFAVVLFLAVFLFSQNNSTKQSITKTVQENSVYLEEIAEKIIENKKVDDISFKNCEINYWQTSDMVEFIVNKGGIGSSSEYSGFYYSPDDKPLGFQGTEVVFTEYENGWKWNESGGDNWEYTEKIADKWYYFEMHF